MNSLGGGNSFIFSYVHPDPWGFMIQFDLRIFFKWVGEKPSSSNIHTHRFFVDAASGRFYVGLGLGTAGGNNVPQRRFLVIGKFASTNLGEFICKWFDGYTFRSSKV